MYSQNNEDEIVSNFFKGEKGTLLSIGENDGRTLSNSLRLIEEGWRAVLVEPSKEAFQRMQDLHKYNNNVLCVNYGIGDETGNFVFYESGTHLNKNDISLLSTLDASQIDRWKSSGEQFTKKEIQCLTYSDFCLLSSVKQFMYEKLSVEDKNPCIHKFDYITIDAEGFDWKILSQIDLSYTKLVIVEVNNTDTQKYIDYCNSFGLREIHRNYENIIFSR